MSPYFPKKRSRIAIMSSSAKVKTSGRKLCGKLNARRSIRCSMWDVRCWNSKQNIEHPTSKEEASPRRIFRAGEFPPVDVRELPVPRYDLLGNRPYNRFTVQTSRGCPWRCDFCASNVMLGQGYRKRPVDHVIRDIRAIEQVRRHPFIEFADDNTFVDKEWGEELC